MNSSHSSSERWAKAGDQDAGPTPILVIGYGNTLRGDDGVGPRAVETLSGMELPGVRTLLCHQLAPEHAAPLSRANIAIFVDAAADGSKEVQWRKLEPARGAQVSAHAADPRSLLALARDVFGHSPEAWWVTIPAYRMEFGEDLTPQARQGLEAAVASIWRFAAPGSPHLSR
jgi:hydrogenase maturation protease